MCFPSLSLAGNDRITTFGYITYRQYRLVLFMADEKLFYAKISGLFKECRDLLSVTTNEHVKLKTKLQVNIIHILALFENQFTW